MKKLLSLFLLLTLIGSAAGLSAARAKPVASEGGEANRTLSPYFFVRSDDPATDRLPLKSTAVKADVSGVIADVKVTQVYRNEGKHPLEAVYVFPGSTRAAVYGMKMAIGSRTIVAKIREREKARQEYEQAKQQGKSASLLEQQRPNVFQMNVANIMPGDEIRVELSYTELLTPVEGVYEFDYPTVVGPRYSNRSAEESSSRENWVKSPYLQQGEEPPYTFDMNVTLASGIPLKEITSPSHIVDISYQDASRASVRLSPAEKKGGNRDFTLKYRLAGGAIESGLLVSQGEKENFFLLMMEPPKRVKVSQIPPREYIFIVDVSGSMHGFPLDVSKKLLNDLIGHLRPTDRFNVLLFAGGSALMAPESLPATRDNVAAALEMIDRQQGGGGTELLPAMKRALSIPKPEGFSRTVVIATDGYVSVEAETFDLIRKKLCDANMFAFGIGTGVNRFLIEGMARAGLGEAFVVTKQEEAQEAADRFRSYIQSPVLTGIKVAFNGFDAYDVEPPAVPDLLAERPLIIFGKWHGPLQGTITVKGISGDGKYERGVDVAAVQPLTGNSALALLWARQRIAVLGDYEKLQHDDERVKTITSLGLTYSLLTEYTSFVAIDSEVRNKGGESTTVQQPLPLPQGVSDLAVGAAKCAPAYAAAPASPADMAYRGSFGGTHRAKTAHKAKAETRAMEERTPWQYSAEPKSASVAVNVDKISWKGAPPKGKLLTDAESWKPYLREITACYNTFLQKHPGTKGKLILRLVIGKNGDVSSVSLVSSSLNQPVLEAGIMELVKKWTLPVSTGNGSVVELPLVLTD